MVADAAERRAARAVVGVVVGAAAAAGAAEAGLAEPTLGLALPVAVLALVKHRRVLRRRAHATVKVIAAAVAAREIVGACARALFAAEAAGAAEGGALGAHRAGFEVALLVARLVLVVDRQLRRVDATVEPVASGGAAAGIE